jgi:hypothetical protein
MVGAKGNFWGGDNTLDLDLGGGYRCVDMYKIHRFSFKNCVHFVCVCVCGTGVLTRGFALAKQALCHLSHSTYPTNKLFGAYNPSAWKAKAGGAQVQDQPAPHKETSSKKNRNKKRFRFRAGGTAQWYSAYPALIWPSVLPQPHIHTHKKAHYYIYFYICGGLFPLPKNSTDLWVLS